MLRWAVLACLMVWVGPARGQTPGFVGEAVFFDTFGDGLVDGNEGVGGGWNVSGSGLGNFPQEEVGGALRLYPVEETAFDWIGQTYAPRDAGSVFPLGDAGSSWVFEWVVEDLEVTTPRSAGGADVQVQLGVLSSEVRRLFQLGTLWHHDDGGVMIFLHPDSDGAGETSVGLGMLVADETNLNNSHNGVVGAFPGVRIERAVFGESGGVWSDRRLTVRLALDEQGGGVYGFRLLAKNSRGEVAVDESGVLDVGPEFVNGAYPFFGMSRVEDGIGSVGFGEVKVVREPEGGGGALVGRVWQDLDGDGVADLGETEVPGVAFDVVSVGGERVRSETDGDGFFRVEVVPGAYSLEFVAPSGYGFVARGGDSAADGVTGATPRFVVEAGDVVEVPVGMRRTGFGPAVPGGGTLAYDGFDYPVGMSLREPMPDGGEGLFWEGPWRHHIISGNFTDAVVHTGGMTDARLPASSGTSLLTFTGRSSRGFSTVFGEDGSEVFVSYLVYNQSPYFPGSGSPTSQLVEFYEGSRASLSLGLGGIGGVYLVRPTPNEPQAVNRRIERFDSERRFRLVVVRFSFGDGDIDTADVWIDPAPFTDFSAASNRVFGTGMGFDRISVFAGVNEVYLFDEFRLGSRARDVLDGGFFPPTPTVAGRVWEDVDGDGVQDEGEPGLAGVGVVLLDASGIPLPDAVATTGGDGTYAFPELLPGAYSVAFSAPAGFRFSPEGRVVGDVGDSDASALNGRTAAVDVGIAETEVLDAGLYRSALVAGRVWDDLDADGVQDSGEPGVPGVVVSLSDAGGVLVGDAVSGVDGAYQFPGLAVGGYVVSVAAPAGRLRSPANVAAAGDGADSDVGVGDGRSAVFSLGSGAVADVDAGLYAVATVRGRVWADADSDGVQDASEAAGVGGVGVRLISLRGGFETEVGGVASDGGGRFLFSGLDVGRYVLEFAIPGGRNVSPAGRGGDGGLDSDLEAGERRSGVFELSPGSGVVFDVGILPLPPTVVVAPEGLEEVARQVALAMDFNPTGDPGDNLVEVSFECPPLGTSSDGGGASEAFFPEFQIQKSPDMLSWEDVGEPLAPRIGGGGGRKAFRLELVLDEAAFYRIQVVLDEGEFSVVFPKASNPAYFPLDGGGSPGSGGVAVLPDGSYGPFAYIPEQNGGAGFSGGLQFVFPEGGRVALDAGLEYLEYGSVEVGFGEESILQLDVDGEASLAFGGEGVRLELGGGEFGRLPLGELRVADLAVLLGLDPADGVPVRLFERFPLMLKGGVFTRHGIEGAVFGLGSLGIPLPEETGAFAGFTFPLGAGRHEVSVGAHGTFELAEGSGRLVVSEARPLRVGFLASGEIVVSGQALLEFDSGLSVAVRVTLDDTKYCLEVDSRVVGGEVLEAILPLLPADAVALVPGAGADEAAVAEAERALEIYRKAYRGFGQLAQVAVPAGSGGDKAAGGSGPLFALTPLDEATPAVTVLAALAEIPDVAAVDSELIQELAVLVGQQADVAASCLAGAEQLVAVGGLFDALRALRETGGGGQAEAEAAVLEAYGDAKAQMIRLADDLAGRAGTDCTRVAVGLLAAVYGELAGAGLPDDAELLTAMQTIAIGTVGRYTKGLGVVAGVSDFSSNPTIAGMNRFTAVDHLATLISLHAEVGELSVNPEALPGFTDAALQVLGKVAADVDLRIVRAGFEENVPAYILALTELGDVYESAQRLGVSETAIGVGIADLVNVRLVDGEVLMASDLARPERERTSGNGRLYVRALAALVDDIPESSRGAWTGIIGVVHEGLAETLPGLVGALGGDSRTDLYLELIEAGAGYMRLGRQIDSIDNVYDWERQGLPVLVTKLLDSMGGVELLEAAPAELAVERLQAEVGRLNAQFAAALQSVPQDAALTGELLEARRLYGEQVARLLGFEYEVIVAPFGVAGGVPLTRKVKKKAGVEKAGGGVAASGDVADVELTSDVVIRRAGGFLCYDRVENVFSGSVTGELHFPNAGLALRIQRGRVSSRGQFDLAVSGQLDLPVEGPVVVVAVREEEPLRVFYDEDEGFGVEGKARVQLENGVFFEVALQVADPLYAFEVVAGSEQHAFATLIADAAATSGEIVPLVAAPAPLSAGDKSVGDRITLRDQLRGWAAFQGAASGHLTRVKPPPAIPGEKPLRSVSVFEVGDVYSQAEIFACLIDAEDFEGDVAEHLQYLGEANRMLRQLDPELTRERSLFEQVVDFFAEAFTGQGRQATFAQEAKQLDKISKSYQKISRAMAVLGDEALASGAGVESPDLDLLKGYLDAAVVSFVDLTGRMRDPESASFEVMANREVTGLVTRAGLDLVAAYVELGHGTAPLGFDLEFVQQWMRDAAFFYLLTIGYGEFASLPSGEQEFTFGPNAALIGTYFYEEAKRNLRRYLEVMGELELAAATTAEFATDDRHVRAMLDQMERRIFRGNLEYNEELDLFILGERLGTRRGMMDGVARLLELQADQVLLLGEDRPLPASLTDATPILFTVLADRLRELPPERWKDRVETIEAIMGVNVLRELAGETALVFDPDPELVVIASLNAGAGRISAEELPYFEIIKGRIDESAELRAAFEARLNSARLALSGIFEREWGSNEIEIAPLLGTELLVLDELMAVAGKDRFPPEALPEALMPRLLDKLEGAAVQAQDPRVLAEFAAVVIDGSEGIKNEEEPEDVGTIPTVTVRSTGFPRLVAKDEGDKKKGKVRRGKNLPPEEVQDYLLEVALGALNANRPLIAQYATILPGMGDGERAQDGKLPGEIQVRRVSGALMFNRETGAWRGAFGGRLEFGDPRVFFEITEASLASDGSFVIAASTGGVLEPNGDGSLTLSGGIEIRGDADGLDRIGGSGLLSYRPDPGGDPVTVEVRISYRPDLPGRPLRISGTAEDLAGVTQIGNDFVLFGGGVNLEFSTDTVGQERFSVEFGTTAGLFSRVGTLPTGRAVTEDDFHLIVAVPSVTLSSGGGETVVGFDGAEIKLSDDFEAAGPNGDARDRPTVAIDGAFEIRHDDATGGLSVGRGNGEPVTVGFEDIRFPVPGLEGFVVTVDSAVLEFVDGEAPVLRDLDATLAVPVPGARQLAEGGVRTSEVQIRSKRWRLDGFPEDLAITLEDDLRLVGFGGEDGESAEFTVDLLGGADGGTTLAFETVDLPSGERRTAFIFEGAMRVGLAEGLMKDEATGAGFALTAGGRFRWDGVDAPELALDVLEIAGRFNLGGADGVTVRGIDPEPLASIRLDGLGNLFNQSPETPFRILIDGAIDVGGIAEFGLVETGLVFEGDGVRFRTGGFIVGAGEKTIDLVEGTPVYVSELGFFLRNPDRALVPPAGVPGLFDADNIRLVMSGGVHLPSREAIEAGSPGISGQVRDLEITFVEVGGGGLEPRFNTNGLGMQIENLDIPPLMGLSGGLFIGNLNFPESLYFVGVVEGKVNDAGAEILLALDRNGMIGACFALDLGPVGIPIDGGALGGLMLTGVKGGVSFQNGFLDPCDFESFIRFEEVGGVVMPVNDGQEDVFVATDPGVAPEPVTPRGWEHCLVENVGGEFPVASVNPLCMPHPTIGGRVVYKGTVLGAVELGALGITPLTVPGTVDGAAGFVAERLVEGMLGLGDPFVELINEPEGTPGLGFVTQKVEEVLQGFRDVAEAYVRGAIDEELAANGQAPDGAGLYGIVETVLGRGVPCQDSTLRVEATLSHATTPSMVKGNVGALLSTTGTVILDGDIEVSGIPFGEGEFIFQLTDQNGNINPSFGGLAFAGVGPIEFGSMSFGYQCAGCTTGFFEAFGEMLAGGFGANDFAVREGLLKLMDRVVPDGAPRSLAAPVTEHFDALGDAERLGYLASVANLFVMQAAGNEAPLAELFGPDADVLLDAFMESYVQFQTAVQVGANPVFCFEQVVQPKLFGWPLGSSVFVSLNYNARVHDAVLDQDFQQFSAGWGFSPTTMLMQLLTGGAGSALPPGPDLDFAEMSFSYRVPSWDAQRVRQSIEDPAGFAAQSTAEMMADMVVGFGYEITPLGLKLGNGQGRIIMPRLETHPTRPGVDWELPSGAGVATRSEVILAALNRGRLKDATWRGVAGELGDVFFEAGNGLFTPTDGSCAGRVNEIALTLDPEKMAGLGFAEDYFPYGGLIGGAELSLPNFITELPPAELLGLFVVPLNLEDAEAWLENATFVFEEYLAGTTCAGQVAFYLPAPNPLQIDWATAGTDELMKAVSVGDFGGVVERTLPEGVYAFDQILLEGWLEAKLMGLPLGRATILFDPAGGPGNAGRFLVTAEIPPGTWLSDFLNADVEIEVLGPRGYDGGNLVEADGERAAGRLGMVGGKSAGDVLGDGGAFIEDTLSDLGDMLPRASMHAGASLQIPPELASFINTEGQLALEVFSFSPAYEPDFMPESDDPYAIARRRGGAGVRGSFNLGYYPEVGEAIEFNIDNAAFAVTPTADPSIFPALSGKVELGAVQNVPFFPPIRSGELTLNTSPDDGFPFVAVEMNFDPFSIGALGFDFLRFESLNGPGEPIGGRFEVARRDEAPLNAEVSLEIQPLSASLPWLGNGVGITVYGEEIGGEFTPFTFSTSPQQEWAATVCISDPSDPNLPPSFEICDPDNPGGGCVVEFAPTGPVCGRARGRGLGKFEIEAQIPAGTDVVFFRGTELETRLTIGLGEPIRFYVNETGQFYLDFATGGDVGLPGVLTANGHVTFGFNPTGSVAVVRADPGLLAFGGVDVLEAKTLSLTVENNGLADANCVFRAEPAGVFTVNHGGMRLSPGQGNVVDVIFQPRRVGAVSGSLVIESNDPERPVVRVPLTGEGTALPRYFQSSDEILFGDTAAGETASGTVTIGNAGSAPMVVTDIGVNSLEFSLDPDPATLTLGPGESQLFVVSFTPLEKRDYEAFVTVEAGLAGRHEIRLTGRGTDPLWVLAHDAESLGRSATLNDVLMLDHRQGWVVGDGGTVLETADGGRSFTALDVTFADMKALGLAGNVAGEAIAEYHFEDPPGTLTFEDVSGNGLTAFAPKATQAPAVSFEHGRFGSGLGFDGSDVVEFPFSNVAPSFALSLWVNPVTTAAGQAFVSRNGSSGSDDFVLGFFGSNYRLVFMGESLDFGVKRAGWQHLVVNVVDTGATTTRVEVFRDGVEIGSRTFLSKLAATGRNWALGQEWDGAVQTDFFRGAMDEFYFFVGEKAAEQIRFLQRGGQRVVMAGSDGMVFETFNAGAVWSQVADQNVFGFRGNLATFEDYEWRGAAIGAGGRLLLGGVRNGSGPILMLEGAGEFDPYAEISFGALQAGETVNDVFVGGVNGYAVSSAGRIYRGAPVDGTWSLQGDFPRALNSGVAFSGTGYFAVGDGGLVVRSTGGSPEALELPNLTENLRSVRFDAGLDEEAHLVGDGGVYATNRNQGSDWLRQAEGQRGDMRGIAVQGAGASYEAWAVGEESAIQYRGTGPLTGPFMAFYPGQLDFGSRLIGESKTLPVKVYNRGNDELVLTSVRTEGDIAYSVVQGAVGGISPGDSMTLYVRYRPPSPAVQDLGRLVLQTNDGGRQFSVPLRGSASGREWQLAALGVRGKVSDVVFTTALTGYAIVDGDEGGFFRTVDGGVTWTKAPFALGGGERFDFMGMDFVGNGAGDDGFLTGQVVDAGGGFVRGVILKTHNGGIGWSLVTPPGGDGLAFADVKIHDAAVAGYAAVVSSDPVSGTGDVWQTENAGATWVVQQRRPAAFFDGSTVGVVPNPGGDPEFSRLFATSGNVLHGKGWGENWSGFPGQVFNPGQTVRGFEMFDDPALNFLPDYAWLVGDRGLFWRWDRSQFSPAGNAEVFGTTDLSGVAFAGGETGWIVGGSKIFSSADSGQTWGVQLRMGEAVEFACVEALAADRAWAGGSVAGEAVVWRYETRVAPAAGVLAVNDIEFFGSALRGEEVVQVIELENVGGGDLELQNLGLVSDDPLPRFRILSENVLGPVGPGETVDVEVAFRATPEAALVDALAPEVFLRFEQGLEGTEYFDDSGHLRHGRGSDEAGRTPEIVDGPQGRDRCLRFDGDDYAEVDGFDEIGEAFSFSVWVNFPGEVRNQVIFGKHGSGGEDLIVCGVLNDGTLFKNSGWYFGIRNERRAVVAPRTGWHHVAVTGEVTGGQTAVTFYLDGEVLWEEVFDAVAGDVSGLPWILGGGRGAGGEVRQQLTGCIDDFGVFGHVLTPGEVSKLAHKSPLYGEHRAALVIDTDTELGRRTVELRGEVVEESSLLVFNTEPANLPVTIDGVEYETPVAFSVGSLATGGKEWGEGSMHQVEVADRVGLSTAGGRDLGDNRVDLAFEGFGTSGKRSFQLCATKGAGEVTAKFRTVGIADPTPPVAAAVPPRRDLDPGAGIEAGGDGWRQDVFEALGGTPVGPFFRLSEGNLTLLGVVGGGFQIDGELFISPTRMYASVDTSPIVFGEEFLGGPNAFFEIGASHWLLDYTAGEHFILKAHPPNVSLFGLDVLPDARLCIEFGVGLDGEPDPNSYRLAFGLDDDMRVIPDVLEFKQGEFAVGFDGGTGQFSLDWTGGMRVLKLPDESYLFDADLDLHFASPRLDGFSLKQAMGLTDEVLLDFGEFELRWPEGDLKIDRDGGVWRLVLENLDFWLMEQEIARVSGSIGLDGVLAFYGSVNEVDLCFREDVCFSLRTPGGDGDFLLRLGVGLPPTLRLLLPEMQLHSSLPVWPAGGITLPGLDFDSSVTFDSGLIPLPVLSFDGIEIASPDDGSLANNHLRFQGGLERGFRFDLRSEMVLDFGFLECQAGMGLFVDNLAVGGALSSNFCWLPEPLSVEYNPGDPDGCEFESVLFGLRVKFGSECAELEFP